MPKTNSFAFAIGIGCISLIMIIDGFGTYFQSNIEIQILWNTGTTIQLMGYNLYRSDDINGNYIKVNDSLIPIPNDLLLSNEIKFIDFAGRPENNFYYYRIEEVYLNGFLNQKEPIQICVNRVIAPGAIIGFIILVPMIFQIRHLRK